MEAAANKFSEDLNTFLNKEMDRSLPLMTKIFTCNAKCTSEAKTHEQAVPCLTRCQAPLEELQAFTEQKVNQLQRTIGNCQMKCAQLIKENDTKDAEACVVQCLQTHTVDLENFKTSVSKFQDSLTAAF